MKTETRVEITPGELREALCRGLSKEFFKKYPSFLQGDGKFSGHFYTDRDGPGGSVELKWEMDEKELSELVVPGDDGGNGVKTIPGLEKLAANDFGPAVLLYIGKDAARCLGFVALREGRLGVATGSSLEWGPQMAVDARPAKIEVGTLMLGPGEGSTTSEVLFFDTDGELIVSYIPANRDLSVFDYYKISDDLRTAVQEPLREEVRKD